jgi:hypothetical protein
MGIPLQALELENQAVGPQAAPTLGAAYELLRDQWRRGDRDRELALHLMFLSWYLLIEPAHLTGLDEGRVPSAELVATFNEVHDHMAPAKRDDAELLYVVGLMSHLAPWLLGDIATWESRSRDYWSIYRRLVPNGLNPNGFAGRGAYGDYFGRQARVTDGY